VRHAEGRELGCRPSATASTYSGNTRTSYGALHDTLTGLTPYHLRLPNIRQQVQLVACCKWLFEVVRVQKE